MIKDETLRGLRCLGLARASTGVQAEDSHPQQVGVLKNGSDFNEMIWVGVEHETTSGSDPGNRDDLTRLLERKRIKDDYDVLLVQEGSRLTRAGQQHGSWIRTEFARLGVRVVSLSSRMDNSRFAWLEQGIEDDAAHDYVQKLSFNTLRGTQQKLSEDVIAYSKRPPYGVDRLYLNHDLMPLHIIRNLTDGRQQRLHHETKEVLETYPKEVKGTQTRHFSKQASDRVVLIPGADECVEIVRFIFEQRYIVGLGASRIATLLSERGAVAAKGLPWMPISVTNVYSNPIYTGRGISN